MYEDIIFYISLLVTITLASNYKKIKDLEEKRKYGTGVGILIACTICGTYIYHTILMLWGNLIIIKCCDKRYMHVASLSWTWLYLIYLHINLTDSVYVIWLHQNFALRLVGMAFEIHVADKINVRHSSHGLSIGDIDHSLPDPSFMDIITYTFFFAGLHKGPYYTWKILNEHLKGSFGNLGDFRVITEQKLKRATICTIGWLLLRRSYSPNIYTKDSFYFNYDMDTQYLYNIPLLLMYFLQNQVVMLLCTSVCTEAGFGVYPAKSNPLPGLGPSVHLSLLKLVHSPEKALDQEYNFSMLKCYDNEKVILGPRMTDTIRGWDMPTRYWFWTNIFKNLSFVKDNKEIRGTLSFLAWTLWKGPSIQQIIISSTLWIYINLESEYSTIYNTTGTMKVPWYIGFTMMRMFCLIYLTPCFIVDDASVVFKYYNSIFWVYHIILLVLIIGAIVAYKTRIMM